MDKSIAAIAVAGVATFVGAAFLMTALTGTVRLAMEFMGVQRVLF